MDHEAERICTSGETQESSDAIYSAPPGLIFNDGDTTTSNTPRSLEKSMSTPTFSGSPYAVCDCNSALYHVQVNFSNFSDK